MSSILSAAVGRTVKTFHHRLARCYRNVFSKLGYNIGVLIRVTSARDPQQLKLLDDEVTSVVTGLWSYEESAVLLARCALTVYVTLHIKTSVKSTAKIKSRVIPYFS